MSYSLIIVALSTPSVATSSLRTASLTSPSTLTKDTAFYPFRLHCMAAMLMPWRPSRVPIRPMVPGRSTFWMAIT